MSISQTVVDFITLAIDAGGWMEMDRLYLQNRLLALVGETELEPVTKTVPIPNNLEMLDKLMEQALKNQVIQDEPAEREILEGQIMDLVTPPPSVLNALFAETYAKDVQAATDYFFHSSKQNDYIKTRAIAKNIVFPAPTIYGELEITINLSKPEKDPKQIALEKSAPAANYPKCLLCMENEGYLGRLNYPARTNHRIIRMNLEGESWGFQYSPYAYFNEHSIFLSEEHRPMVISKNTFKRLLQIVEIFPHYFVGSNADLPIVGGSILSHDHYQGGRHDFPMATAPQEQVFELSGFSEVQIGIVKWPMSVLRLQSKQINHLVNAAEFVTEKWRNYSDPELQIQAFSADGTSHHTVTPIARKVGEVYELDLVLRDNNTSTEHPDGIFHPHQDVQHIKKENIGLIEVMGLAVLPPRLKVELAEIKDYLLGQGTTFAEAHRPWVARMKAEYTFTEENAMGIIQAEVGQIFARVLEDAGVYKRNQAGQAGFIRFIEELSK